MKKRIIIRSERENSNKKKIGGTEVNVRTQRKRNRIREEMNERKQYSKGNSNLRKTKEEGGRPI